MVRAITRREALRAGAVVGGAALAGCTVGTTPDRALFEESFESGVDGWTKHAHIGPEEPLSAFEWAIDRSREQAHDGEWSLEVFTEGDHDDGTAWVTTELDVPSDAAGFDVSVQAWSLSESFNTLRNVVLYLGPEEPTGEGDFPDPGANSTAVEDAPFGGLREPLHLAEGWYEYTFEWDPDEVPDTVYFAAGVSVVWEADATHYLDAIEVTAA